ncbi:PilZ domain-containing protein [Erythrobacter sp. SG61-1L]|uniref:PilZ domain-containing protein n=1 Tax=Erythrobacter sp. SG61-1L TaxID=1603897 RepID=UPI0006C93673|nr:PilZ domain-containing protein [Erythrobacter sp. SG61-1L]
MDNIERRSSPRAGTRKQIRLRDAFQLVPGAVLMDLSVTGCQVSLRGVQLAIGQIVVVRPDGLEGLSGVVRWIEGGRVGIEFDRPLHPGVAAHIVAAPAPAPGGALADYSAPSRRYVAMQLLKSVA